MQRIVINVCFGGFGLSEAAYEKLIEWGVPVMKVRKYVEQKQNPETGLYDIPEPAEVIFDRTLEENESSKSMLRLCGRYWDTWLSENRTHELLIRVVEEIGEAANGDCAKLKIVEVPDGVEWKIDDYDGNEQVAEKHRAWG